MFYQQPTKEVILYTTTRHPDKLFRYLYPYQTMEWKPNQPQLIVCKEIGKHYHEDFYANHFVFHPEQLTDVTKEWIIIGTDEDVIEIR